MIKKLTSRKFWVAVAGIASGVLVIVGYSGGTAETVSGAIMVIGSAVGYMVSEGVIDAARVGQIVGAAQDAADAIKDGREA